MKRIYASLLLVLFTGFSFMNNEQPPYLNPSLPVKKRVEDLMSRMTIEEKVAQMNQFVGLEHMRAAERDLEVQDLGTNTARGFYPGKSAEDIARMTADGQAGSFLHVTSPGEANMLQQLARKSRLKIPLLIGIDAIHGNGLVKGCTVYPSNLGMASTFDPALLERTARQTALEMRATGSQWTFNPNLEIARDPRWGRTGETFGEDPYLVTQMGLAAVSGYQTSDFSGTDKVLACAKHFLGCTPVNGTNGAPADVSERTIREIYLPSFKAVIESGVFTVMTAHNEVNGIPSHSNSWLLQNVLREEWGFRGFVVSDWMDIENLHSLHRTAENFSEAFYQSIEAGMDMHMHGPDFYYKVLELIKAGRITEQRIQSSCSKILEAKFRLGLFEHPFVDVSKMKEKVFTKEHQSTALEAARKSIVLLKNNGILPLDEKKYRKVFVTGSNADNQTILGDWAFPQPDEHVVTVLEGLRQVSPLTDFHFLDQGWDVRNLEQEKIDLAAEFSKKADLNIVVVGEYALRHKWNERTGGEDVDRSDIYLAGKQQQLVEKVQASGKPTIVVLVNGRPLGVEWIAENCAALLEAWEPGCFGGQAVAEILYGKVNPSAKLPVTMPRHAGQLPQFYNYKPSMYFHPYVLSESTPLFPFGYGLSYTTYKYKNLRFDKEKIKTDGFVMVNIDVENTGKYGGEEIVQLYIRDEYSSATRPVKELRDFTRVSLQPGEIQTVSFRLPAAKLAFYDKNMQWKVEPGSFKIMVGGSSADNDLQSLTLLVEE